MNDSALIKSQPEQDDASRAWLAVDRAALECAFRGFAQIALYGAGRFSRRFVRQPWRWRGIEVVAILDDKPRVNEIGGVPVITPRSLEMSQVDAIVICSDTYEWEIAEAAKRHFGDHIPVLRIMHPNLVNPEAGDIIPRLVGQFGLDMSTARWLIDNRFERHDANLPMLAPARTELHLRRYDFACAKIGDARAVLDCACGLGYGSALLASRARGRRVIGLDVDIEAVQYAERRYGDPVSPQFRLGDATTLDTIDDDAIDAIVSFETIEHVPEAHAMLRTFKRKLRDGGTLVLSTPNDRGLTDYHVHSFDRETVTAMLHDVGFTIESWCGQVEGDAPNAAPLPPGMFDLDDDDAPTDLVPETLLVVARRT